MSSYDVTAAAPPTYKGYGGPSSSAARRRAGVSMPTRTPRSSGSTKPDGGEKIFAYLERHGITDRETRQ